MNTHRHVLIGLIGAALLVSTPSYSRQDDQDDQDNKRPPAVSELYTPAMRNLGFIECIVVNIDTSPHNAQIEVFFHGWCSSGAYRRCFAAGRYLGNQLGTTRSVRAGCRSGFQRFSE